MAKVLMSSCVVIASREHGFDLRNMKEVASALRFHLRRQGLNVEFFDELADDMDFDSLFCETVQRNAKC